jgi:hypothetical protein
VNPTMVLSALLATLFATQAGAQAIATPKGASDAAKAEASAEHLSRMKTAVKVVIGRVDEARDEKDIVKLNCVNEKLTQMKAFLKVAEQADVALNEALATRGPGADAEFSKIAIARTKVDGLRAESEQCIGRLSYIVDEKTTVEVMQPSNLPPGGGEDLDVAAARASRVGHLPAPPVVRPPPASRWY